MMVIHAWTRRMRHVSVLCIWSNSHWRDLAVEVLERMTVNPEQCGGRPCIRGMRIQVSDVLDRFAAGLSPDAVLEELPDLEPDDLRACFHYAARRVDHSVLRAA
jgi:uncharacterized protein (DUF433 family)